MAFRLAILAAPQRICDPLFAQTRLIRWAGERRLPKALDAAARSRYHMNRDAQVPGTRSKSRLAGSACTIDGGA